MLRADVRGDDRAADRVPGQSVAREEVAPRVRRFPPRHPDPQRNVDRQIKREQNEIESVGHARASVQFRWQRHILPSLPAQGNIALDELPHDDFLAFENFRIRAELAPVHGELIFHPLQNQSSMRRSASSRQKKLQKPSLHSTA